MDDKRLQEIEDRYLVAGAAKADVFGNMVRIMIPEFDKLKRSSQDIPDLLAEVKRLNQLLNPKE